MKKSEKFWDMVSKNYDKDEKRFEQIGTKVIEYTKKHLKASDIVLDYGCATGTKAIKLASTVSKIQGIDISSKMIKTARRKTIEHKIENINFTHATIFDKNLKKESFDVILAFNILHTLEDNNQAIQRVKELLKPEGLFISTTPCLREKMTFLTKSKLIFYLFLIKLGLLPNILTRFKISELINLITNGNFQIIESKKFYFKMSSYFIVAKKN